MIEVEGLSKNYGDVEALKSISFRVEEGSVFGFIGRNGAGKTTTMNILTGLMGYDGGSITMMGMDLSKDRSRMIRHIGYLPEAPAFYDYMNAYEYLELLAGIAGQEAGTRQGHIKQLLETVTLKKDAGRKIGGYSRGMKQRLALAAAILDSPRILFLDEPSSALDPEGRREMLDLIDELKQEKITIFLSTHILSDAERVCDTICVIDGGSILLTESLEQLYKKHMHPVLDIEFEKDPEHEARALQRLDWVREISLDGKRLTLKVDDMGRSRKAILRELAGYENHVAGFQVRKMKLEDIFIGTVNKGEDV